MKTTQKLYVIAFVLLIFGGTSCSRSTASEQSAEKVRPVPQDFPAYRGINIAHWLSQVFGWSPRATFFTESDVALLDSIGFDHIRLPVDEEQLWNEDGSRIEAGFAAMTSAVDWCVKREMGIIIDLHIIRAHHFNAANGEGAMTLWSDTIAQNNFLRLWDDLQSVLHSYPTNLVAYELMNEPAAPQPEQWNALVARALQRIRKTEPERIIFVGANSWQTLANIPLLQLPKDDENLVLSFHNYDPLLVTHFRAQWTSFKDFKGPVQYPGMSARAEDLRSQLDTNDQRVMDDVARVNGVFNREVFDTIIYRAVKHANKLGLSLYCGEFGCLANVDTATRYAYYRDFVGVLNKYAIGRANWDFKGSFKTFGYDDVLMQDTPWRDTVLIKILTQ